MELASPSATRRLARIAGLLYLIVAIFGGLAEGVIEPGVYVAGDAAKTAGNVVANAGFVRFGVAADLFQATVFLFLGLTLWLILRDVDRNAAGTMVILMAIATTIICVSGVFEFVGLRVATDKSFATAFGTAGSNGLVLLLLDLQHYGILIAQIFFGLWLFPLAYLANRSGRFPRGLGFLLAAGAMCYLADVAARLLFPDIAPKIGPIVIVSTVAELFMIGYLLVKGVRVPRAA
jgi:Domain of unknown function (DUF4386)